MNTIKTRPCGGIIVIQKAPKEINGILNIMEQNTIQIPESKLSRFLFSDTRMSWIWLALRIYVGLQWFVAGWEKFMNPAWVGSSSGTAIQGFFMGVLQKTGGAHPDVSSWYGYFISNFAVHHVVLFSYLVTFGEMLIGLGLILGAFVGIAAFFGAFLNFNFLLAGTVSISPILLFIELFLILAWRNAGWIGIDRWLLPMIGVPWKPGKLFK